MDRAFNASARAMVILCLTPPGRPSLAPSPTTVSYPAGSLRDDVVEAEPFGLEQRFLGVVVAAEHGQVLEDRAVEQRSDLGDEADLRTHAVGFEIADRFT